MSVPAEEAEISATSAVEQSGQRQQSGVSPWATLAVLCSSLVVLNLDTTVLNVALPALVRDLHATSSQLQWVVDAYALVFGGLLLVAGSLADRIGRKRTFLIGLLAFACGSAWAAFSGSVGVLIAARASMGVGAALMMPSTLSIITNVFRHPAERQRAIGIWAGSSGLGFALGPIVGGLLLAHFWWGSVFLINVPIAFVAALLALPLVPDSRNPAALRPDVTGAFLSIGGVGLILWAVIEAPIDGWASATVIVPGAVGIVLLAAFGLWERTSSHPMLNLEFFRAPSFSVAVSSVGLVMFGLVGSLFLLTQFLQFNLGYSALQAGMRMLPIAAVLAIVAPLSAPLNRLIGTKLATAAGMLLAASGLWMISHATVLWGYGNLLPGMLVVGTGAAVVMPSVSASVMNSVPPSHTGVGSATNGTCIQIGGAVGVAVIGSLLSTRYQHHMTQVIAPYNLPAAIAHTILGSIGGALAVAARVGGVTGELLAHAARSAFISGANLGLLVAALVVLGGAVLAFAALPAKAHLVVHEHDMQGPERSGEPEMAATTPTSGPEPGAQDSVGIHPPGRSAPGLTPPS
jgi:EmrB/QacA subfamily drug resistance transporter